jgi:zinc protease
MARSSQHYPYERAAAILDRTSSSIAAAVQFEYSTFSLTTLDKYRDELLDLWGDMLTAPSFNQDDFDKSKEDALLAVQAVDQSPWSTMQKVINEAYFKGHPYSVNPDGTEESIGPMTAGDARQWYKEYFSADRMFVVAVGDFDPVALGERLETLLGKIPDLRLGAVPEPAAFPMGPSGVLIAKAHDQSKGTVYLRGDFAAPAPGGEDYFATALAARIFSDLLFSVVRDKYGAVYTPSTTIRGFSANYGSIMMYKTNVPDKIKGYIDEAARLMARGRVVSVDPEKTEEDGYMPIAGAIDTYKQLYTNDYFEAVRNNAGLASMMIRSVRLTGDPADWLKDQERIEALDSSAVQRAFETYFMNGAFVWVAVGDQTLLDKLDPRAFESIH